MAIDRDPSQSRPNRVEGELQKTGDKHSWERTVDSVPSDPSEDPKEHEPRRGDFSTREGDFGENTPQGGGPSRS